MVETNPKGTAALPRCPRPRPFDRLKDLPRLPPQFVEPVETNLEVTPWPSYPTPGPLTMSILFVWNSHFKLLTTPAAACLD